MEPAPSPQAKADNHMPWPHGRHLRLGSQLRPHVVWFGETVLNLPEARQHVQEAGRFLVLGTSLEVFPAAGLGNAAR